MIIVFIALLFINAYPMDRMEYEKSAREKKERYEGFVKIMAMLENSEECISELAERREFPQMKIEMWRIVVQDENDDYIILRHEDFEVD